MAYFLKNQNEDQNQQSGNQNQMSGGNIYSTSGSEVSSSTSSNPSGSNNSTNSQSNESGNWVNLNKYLDANQGKIGGYVSSLANPYTSRVDDYTSSLNTNKQKYIDDVNNQNSVKTDSNKSNSIINNYAVDTSKVSDSDWKALQDTLAGYKGPDRYASTGDIYSYYTDKKTADDFGNFGSNFEDQDYRMSLMDKNVSSGGKKLNNFLLGTQDAQKQISDYASQFKDLANMLDQYEAELNSVYDTGVNVSNQNKQAALDNKARIQKEQEKVLKNAYEDQKDQASNNRYNTDNAVNVGKTTGVYGDGTRYTIANNTYNTYTDKSNQAKSTYEKELAELRDRMSSIDNNYRMLNSALDKNFDFGGWGLSDAQRNLQEQRSKNFIGDIDAAMRSRSQAPQASKIFNLLDVNNLSTEGLTAKDIQARYVKGDLTLEDAINQLHGMVGNYKSPSAWDQIKDQSKDIYDYGREKAEEVVTAPFRGARNLIRSFF